MSTLSTTTPLHTVGTVAQLLGRSVFSVRYAIASREIQPVLQHGPLRVFDQKGVEHIRRAIEEIDRRRGR